MAPGPTFIVRLYRRKARSLTGVIEDVRSGIRIPFGSATELWSALLQRSGLTGTARPQHPKNEKRNKEK